MPIYKYKCAICLIECDYDRSIHEEHAPYCCNLMMTQIYSAPGLSFKGTGWGKDA